MERRLKERLVGAAVLVAAAVILIPEMLSGPKRRDDAAAKSQEGEPFKTYTIDLNRSPGAPASATLDERAPPPEAVAPNVQVEQPQASAADSELPGEIPPASAQASPESARPEAAPPPQRSAAESARQPQEQSASPAREAAARPTIASTPTVPTSRGWAVQLGSFSSKATAERVAKEASGSGQTAFVMPVKSGANTLYRVRVGPFADRAAANAALVGLKQRVANAAVVAHP